MTQNNQERGMPNKSVREIYEDYDHWTTEEVAEQGRKPNKWMKVLDVEDLINAILQVIKDEIEKLPLDHFIYPEEWEGLKKKDVDTALDKAFGIKEEGK